MRTLKTFFSIICVIGFFSCINDINVPSPKNNDTDEHFSMGKLHNQIMTNFYNNKHDEKFNAYFHNSIKIRSTNNEVLQPILLQNKELIFEIFHSFVSCIPNEYNNIAEEYLEAFDSELADCLNGASALWYNNEDKGTPELMLMYLKDNQKITEYDYSFLINKLYGKGDSELRSTSTSDTNSLISNYDDIFQYSTAFWNIKYNNATRASDNFAYTAVYDAIGGAIGGVLGSGLPVIGNWLLGTALSTVFSYAADVNGGTHISGAGGSW